MSLSAPQAAWIEAKIQSSQGSVGRGKMERYGFRVPRDKEINVVKAALADNQKAVAVMMAMEEAGHEVGYQLKPDAPNRLALAEQLLGDQLEVDAWVREHLAARHAEVPARTLSWEFFQGAPAGSLFLEAQDLFLRFDRAVKRVMKLPSGMRGTDLSSYVARVLQSSDPRQVPPTVLDEEGVVGAVRFLIQAEVEEGVVQLKPIDLLWGHPHEVPFSVTMSGPTKEASVTASTAPISLTRLDSAQW